MLPDDVLRAGLVGVHVDGTAVLGEDVDADDRELPVLDSALLLVGTLRDLGLDPAALDARHHAAPSVDFVDDARGPLVPVRELLHEPRPAQGVGDRGDAGLVCEQLLGPQRQFSHLLRGEGQRLIPGAREDRLHAAEDGGQHLVRHPYEVVVRLLRGQ